MTVAASATVAFGSTVMRSLLMISPTLVIDLPPALASRGQSVPRGPRRRESRPPRVVRAALRPVPVAPGSRSVPRAGERGDAATDAGRAGGAGLRGVRRSFPDGGR